MNCEYTKWVAMWGNAMSISENRPEGYGKNITLRYPIHCPFNGDKIRLTFDNFCGTEPIQIEKTTVLCQGKFHSVSFDGNDCVKIEAGKNAVSDEVELPVVRGETIFVSFYLKECAQLRSSVYVQGPLSGGKYAVGDCTEVPEFDINISRKTNICYFLSNVSVHTNQENRAIVCYGDSITAQDWPDLLQQKFEAAGINNVAVIRRATSGSRILRQYSCITYESYGLMGKNRFDHELPTDGADTVIIQQGINDIIHPVGTEVNPFRPMSDLPSVQELCAGMDWYVQKTLEFGYKVFLGTLLPIEGWRTYADFREVLKNQFNEYMRQNKNVNGVIDFDLAVQNPENPKSFAKGCDSGDHLHPSLQGYEKMAECAFNVLSKQ
ncbi:MAG: lipase [Treponema sp.]|nr:lipase [Candidatus Treponema equifaecale]